LTLFVPGAGADVGTEVVGVEDEGVVGVAPPTLIFGGEPGFELGCEFGLLPDALPGWLAGREAGWLPGRADMPGMALIGVGATIPSLPPLTASLSLAPAACAAAAALLACACAGLALAALLGEFGVELGAERPGRGECAGDGLPGRLTAPALKSHPHSSPSVSPGRRMGETKNLVGSGMSFADSEAKTPPSVMACRRPTWVRSGSVIG
jgi:hypothetical protein